MLTNPMAIASAKAMRRSIVVLSDTVRLLAIIVLSCASALLLLSGGRVSGARPARSESTLRIGNSINVFVRYGYLSISMKVISQNDSERWLFKEPTKRVFQDIEALTVTTEDDSPGQFQGDFHMEFCDDRNQLFQAYFRDFTIEQLDSPANAFTGGWHMEVAARKLGINSSFIRNEYSYILVRVSRYREKGRLSRPIPENQVLFDDVSNSTGPVLPGDSPAASRFMADVGTHYINSYVTGNSLFQVFVYNRQNYKHIKERLKTKGFAALTRLDLYNYFAPWYAEHLGVIRSASGNSTVEAWAHRKLRLSYYLFTYTSLLKLQGNGHLLRTLDDLLGNEAILALDLKSMMIVFKEPDKREWFRDVLDNYLKLWEVNMW